MTKKGFTIAPETLIALALFAFVVIGMLWLFSKSSTWLHDTIYVIQHGRTGLSDPAAINNFERLVYEITELGDDEYIIIPYTLGKSYTLIGFNSDMTLNNFVTKDKMQPTSDCGESACLCICKDDSCEECAEIKTHYIITDLWPNHNSNAPLTGVVDPTTGVTAYALFAAGKQGNVNWEIKNLFIEKSVKNNRKYVFIGEYDRDTDTRIPKVSDGLDPEDIYAEKKDMRG